MATFTQTGTAVAAGDGTATVIVPGPHRVGTAWQVGQAITQATAAGGTDPCTAQFYRSVVHRSQLLGTSLAAEADTMEGLPGDELMPGDQLVVVFAGCQSGTICTVNIRGTEIDW